MSIPLQRNNNFTLGLVPLYNTHTVQRTNYFCTPRI